MSNIPGLFVLGEANFSDHGANRLGASALMQGLADGYFVMPYTIGNYFASSKPAKPSTEPSRVQESRRGSVGTYHERLLSIKGKRTVTSLHRELGKLMWEKCGMARNEAGLKEALQTHPRAAGGILEERERHRAKTASSTRSSNTPGAWPTSWNSPNCFAWMRWMRRNHAAAISGANSKRPTAKRCGTTSISLMWRRGNIRAPEKPPVLHKEPLVYEEVHMSTGAISEEVLAMNLTLRVWRQKNGKRPAISRPMRPRMSSPDMSFLEMLDVVNEGIDRARPGTDRL